MFRAKILKALALGLCMSALITGAAYAQSGGGSSPSFGGVEDAASSALYEKHREIDRYLFTDHVKDIAKKGIKVVYTGVADDYVEIGLASFNDEQAAYLYDIFGKDQVKVVSAEEVQLYTTAAVDPAVAPDLYDNGDLPLSDQDQIYTIMDEPDASAVDTTETIVDDRVYKGGDIDTAADVAAEEGNLENPDVIFYTTADGVAEPGQEAELVYATGENAVDKSGAEAEKAGLSAPVIILIAAGGAFIIGGGIVLNGKKKTA